MKDNNIGEKIKDLATILLVSAGVSIIMFFYSIYYGNIAIYPIISLLVSIISYYSLLGFGQLILNSDIIVEHLLKKETKSEKLS